MKKINLTIINSFNFLKRHSRWSIAGVIFVIIVLGTYFLGNRGSASTVNYAVVETVERGYVSSGIQASGTIVAARKLNLDIYKQESRIETVNITNGGHVEAGDVLVSFDKSSNAVAVQSGATRVTEAQLSLSEVLSENTDLDSEVTSLSQESNSIEVNIIQATKAITDALLDFLNKDISAIPNNDDSEERIAPVISGYYHGEDQGEYVIEIYRSASNSGYSLRYSGLEHGTQSIYFDRAIDLGSYGLKISFTEENVVSGDSWIVKLPNTYATSYTKNLSDYQTNKLKLENILVGYQIDQTLTSQDLKNEVLTDTVEYRNLNIAKARASLAEAQVSLDEYQEAMIEQDIIAPFSGTIDGLENVVVGATPTRDSDDPVSFGTLISDDFLVRFSLGITDVSKVALGQKVLVTVNSFPQAPQLEAEITSISSLPESDGVAQYEVEALITTEFASLEFTLREGILADIEIVQEEASGVLRVPLTSVRYEQGKAIVDVLGELSREQQEQILRMGVIKQSTTEGTFSTYPVIVDLGIQGDYYVEIQSGLEEGQQILTSEYSEEASSVVGTQFPGAGGGRPPEDSSGASGSSVNSTKNSSSQN